MYYEFMPIQENHGATERESISLLMFVLHRCQRFLTFTVPADILFRFYFLFHDTNKSSDCLALRMIICDSLFTWMAPGPCAWGQVVGELRVD